MKTIQIIIILILISGNLFCQKEASNWYFGKYAGITFNTNSKYPTALTDGKMNAIVYCTSISDKDGNLLFYTNGNQIWNRRHKIMKNGDSLELNFDSYIACFAIKKPLSDSLYYLFTVSSLFNPRGFKYTIINMNEDSSFGSVIKKSVIIKTGISENPSSRITAIKHKNDNFFWILTYALPSPYLKAYLLTDTGLSIKPVYCNKDIDTISHPQGGINDIYSSIMKSNITGTKIAIVFSDSYQILILDFDDSTGLATNPLVLNFKKTGKGIFLQNFEISPDGTKLYVPFYEFNYQWLSQFDLMAGSPNDIINSERIIEKYPRDTIYPQYKAMQLGPDGKLYISVANKDYLAVVNSPDRFCPGCNFVKKAVDLKSGINIASLPYILQSNLQTIISENKVVPCNNQNFDYPYFANIDNLKLIQGVEKFDSSIRLTQSKPETKGALWRKDLFPVKKGFRTQFAFRFTLGYNENYDGSLPGADGIAFVVQNNNNSSIGAIGGGIGFEGIPNSLAIEFDTYYNNNNNNNLNDPNGNHAAIFCNGRINNTADHNSKACLQTNMNIIPIRSDSTVYYAQIDYNIVPGKLRVWLDSTGRYDDKPILELDNFELSKLLDLAGGERAYVGFTSATGESYENHDILNWWFCPKRVDTLTTAVEEQPQILSNNEIKIIPNPAGDHITIIHGLQSGTAAFYNLLGEKVFESKIEAENPLNIDVSAWRSGVYLCVVRGGSGVITEKVVIAR
ncbi:MAG: Protein of unknown function precursor [Ignavibacteria bacterium]|nr:Protein of unknown function precursor [Ignavibacteria bacterium]